MGATQSTHTPYTSANTVPNTDTDKGQLIRGFGGSDPKASVSRVVDRPGSMLDLPPKELVAATLKVGVGSLSLTPGAKEDLSIWADVTADQLLVLLENKIPPLGNHYLCDNDVTDMVVRVYTQYAKYL